MQVIVHEVRMFAADSFTLDSGTQCLHIKTENEDGSIASVYLMTTKPDIADLFRRLPRLLADASPPFVAAGRVELASAD